MEKAITLRALSPDNWRACIDLAVDPDQAEYVAPNDYSLAEAGVFPECNPLAIYADDTMVGFVMYRFDPQNGIPWIDRLMIDRRYQGRGYGRAALQEVVMLIESQSERGQIRLSLVPDNQSAERLYQAIGFVYTGEFVEGEAVMVLHLH